MSPEDHARDMAKEAAGNWRKFESFAWHAAPDDGVDWAIVYTSNRDSGLLEQSNAAQIAAELEQFTGYTWNGEEDIEPDVREASHNHWAVGHVDGFAIRVYCQATRLMGWREPGLAWDAATVAVYKDALKEQGFDPDEDDRSLTDAWLKWCEIKCALDDYPVLDEEDYSRREYESAVEWISSEGTRYLADEGVPEDWAEQVWSWLWENDQGELESRDDQGPAPSRDSIREALRALGWHEPEDDEEEGS